jgi:hypothetical protein
VELEGEKGVGSAEEDRVWAPQCPAAATAAVEVGVVVVVRLVVGEVRVPATAAEVPAGAA